MSPDERKKDKMKVREALNLTGWILLPVYGGFAGWLTYMLLNHAC